MMNEGKTNMIMLFGCEVLDSFACILGSHNQVTDFRVTTGFIWWICYFIRYECLILCAVVHVVLIHGSAMTPRSVERSATILYR